MDFWEADEDGLEATSGLEDASTAGKDAIIFAVEATTSMFKSQTVAASSFGMALRSVINTLRSKLFTSPKDLVGVVLFGTEGHKGVADFEHLTLLSDLQSPEAETVTKLEHMIALDKLEFEKVLETNMGDVFSLHELFWYTLNLFALKAKGKVGVKQLVLITNTSQPHANDEAQKRMARSRARDLHDNGIHLDLLPINDNVEDKKFELKTFYSDILQLANDEPVTNLELSCICDEKSFWEVVRRRVHKKRSLGKIIFNIAPNINVSVSTYNLVQRAPRPSKVRLAWDTNEEVITQRVFVHPNTGGLLLPSEMHKYQNYGDKRIEFTMDETKAIVNVDQKQTGLKLIGFKPTQLVLKYGNFVRSGYFLYPDESLISGSRQFFAALLIKCLEKDVVAICAYKPRARSTPSFSALVPQKEVKDEKSGQQLKPPGFHILFLPFADDLRNVPDSKLVEPEPRQMEAAKEVVKKLKFKHFEPGIFDNPELQTHYAIIEALALDHELEEENLPEDTTLPPLERMDKKLSTIGPHFINTVYSTDYDPNAAFSKRKAVKSENDSKTKKLKTEDEEIEIEKYLDGRSVHKLTVAGLKQVLKRLDISVESGAKKAQLVDAVYQHYGMDQ